MHHRGTLGEASDDFCSGSFAFPVHRLDCRELLGAVSILGQKFVRVRLILELSHDLGRSIASSEDCIIPFVEIEYLPHFAEDECTYVFPYLKSVFGELAEGFSIFDHQLIAVGALP